MSDRETLLLHFRISHYNEKVRWALDHKRWPHRRRDLVPGLHIPQARWLSGQNKLPVIRIGGRVIVGSARILDEIERLQPDPPLYPADPRQREQALAVQRHFDDEVAPEIRRLFWSCYVPHPALAARMACDGFPGYLQPLWRGLYPLLLPLFSGNLGLAPAQLDAARRRLPQHLDWIAAHVGSSGYLVGDAFGLADLCAAAVMSGIVRPPQFPYPLPEPWPQELRDLQLSLSAHPGYRWVQDIYARHRGSSSAAGAGE